MDPERWQRVQELCELIESLPPGERPRRLESLEPDAGVRRDVFALLKALQDEESARQVHEAYDAGLEPEVMPRAINGMRVVELIGSGGSSDVYRAVRTVNGIEQDVAVKWFHAIGAGAEQLDRFTREQQMLAALRHPDIVRFFDAGLTGHGRPYLVMELAEGEPITRASDKKRLTLDERLVLMMAVCDVVQAAHRHLIVHLDLKPSNILVTAEGRVKLLDFGTAKLVDPLAAVTRTEPLTLQYASPERLRGEAVSVACDVYSLGLILFELASGAWPFSGRDSIVSVAERAAGRAPMIPLARVITDEAAANRATGVERLRALVKGDLEAIVAKALAHEPGERYATVADLAEDLRRHRDGEPIRARPLGVFERTMKFTRRHAWSVAAGVTLVAGLAGAAVYSGHQARVAKRAADRAETQNQFLTSLFTLTGTDRQSHHDMTVRELLTLAQERITPSLAKDPAVAIDVEIVLAQGFISQNAFADARVLLERAVQRAVEAGDVAREAIARVTLGYVQYVENHRNEGWETTLTALALWDRQPNRFAPREAAYVLATGAATISYVNTTSPLQRKYYDACERVTRQHRSDVEPGARARCLLGLATSYAMVDSRYDEAAVLLEEAVAILRTDAGSNGVLSTTLQMVGLVERYRGRFDADERAQREAYDLIARLGGPESVAALWQRAVWAASLLGVGRTEEAYREAQSILISARRVYPERGSYLLWTPIFPAMSAACMLHRFQECEAFAREAVQTLGPTPSPDDPRLHAAQGFLGIVLAEKGEFDQARPMLQEAIRANTSRHRTPPYASLLQTALEKASR